MPTLRIKTTAGGPRFYARWRNGAKYVERPVGPAWVVPAGDAEAKVNAKGESIGDQVGPWVERRGRAPQGSLTIAKARAQLDAVEAAWKSEQDRAAVEVDLTPEQVRAQRLRERAAALEAEADALEGDQLVKFSDAAERWYAHRRDVKRRKASTLRDYRNALDTRILPMLGSKALRKIGPADVIAFRDELASAQKKVGGKMVPALTPRTINKYLVLIDGILGLAARPESLGGFGLETNPAKFVEKLPDRRVDLTDYLTAAEVVLVADALEAGKHREGDRKQGPANKYENARDAAAVIVAGFAGLRLGEIIGLRWGDVSLSDSKITVRRAIVRGIEDTPKGKRARDVPMAEPVAKALARLDLAAREFAKSAEIPAQLGADQFVFASLAGERIDDAQLTRRYRNACKAIGLRIVKFHGLRHTFTTTARQGMTADRVQAMAGHEDAATAQRYAHPRSRSTDADVLSRTIAAEIAASTTERGTV